MYNLFKINRQKQERIRTRQNNSDTEGSVFRVFWPIRILKSRIRIHLYYWLNLRENKYQQQRLPIFKTKIHNFRIFRIRILSRSGSGLRKKSLIRIRKKVRIRNTGKDQNFYLDPDPYGNSEKTRLDSDAELNHSRSPTLQRSVKDIGLDLIRYFVKINLPWKYSCWLAS